jgi:hypothetical protein
VAIREMVTCTRCGKTEPVTLRTRICVRRLFFTDNGKLHFGEDKSVSMPFTKSIDLCEDCWNDFKRFLGKEE